MSSQGISGRFRQQPSERRRYRIDYTKSLGEAEIIQAPVTVNVLPVTTPPLVVDGVVIDPEGKQLVLFASGGLSGTTYGVRILAPTNASQILEDDIEVLVQQYGQS